MTANAQYAADAARTAARLIESGAMNADATCAEAAGVAARLQPEAAAVVDSLAVMPASPEYQAAVDWNNALLDLLMYAHAQDADAPISA
ncbi:hypothetical protein M3C36_17600 [Dietzia cinnamea]|uniref:hypothetical protein n=1 Tax=Dietzia TaxID=37914 RepID=UPI000D087CF7|nr:MULTISPECIES: hypothetical protein [Dietzia]AVM66050.1 hypothetical protein C3V38_15950 [Dietzia sp. oral taxon 368]MCT1886963.1 hypothetical protein [Dietzia cinnamea]